MARSAPERRRHRTSAVAVAVAVAVGAALVPVGYDHGVPVGLPDVPTRGSVPAAPMPRADGSEAIAGASHRTVWSPAPPVASGWAIRVQVVDARHGGPVTLHHGRVLGPLALAAVEAAESVAAAEPDAIVACEDADGCSDWSVPQAGCYQLLLGSPEHCWQIASVVATVAEASARARLALEPGVALHGRVVDPDDRPVAEAWVALRAHAGTGAWGDATAADGSFRLPPLPPGLYALQVDARDRPSLQLPECLLAPPAEGRTLRLPVGASLRGHVVPWQAGTAAVAEVRAAGGLRTAPIAVDGTFEFAGLTPGRATVAIVRTAPGLRAEVAARLALAGEGEDLQLVDGVQSERVFIDPAVGLGRVQGLLQGAPASVRVLAQPLGMPVLPAGLAACLQVTPDSSGRFEFDGLRPGSWRFVAVDAQEVVGAALAVDLAPCADHDLRLRWVDAIR